MYAARIIGTVVCTRKDEKLKGLKMQVVQPVNLLTLKDEGKPAVAIDAIGAGVSEIVLVVGKLCQADDIDFQHARRCCNNGDSGLHIY